MTAIQPRLARRQTQGTGFMLLAATIGVVVGILSAKDPPIAVAVCLVAVAAPAAILKPKLVLYGLTVTVFTEFLTVGGVTVGRFAVPLALVAVIAELGQAPARLREGGLILAFAAAYTLLAVASLFWTRSSIGTVTQLGSLGIALVYAAAFAVLVRSERDLRIVFWIITACALVLGLYWIGSFALGVARSANSAGDPNFFAADQVVALPIILVLGSWTKSNGLRALLMLVAAVVAASVVASLSRGGALTLAVGGLLVVLLPGPMLFRTRARKATFIFVAAVGLALIIPVAGPALNQRFKKGLETSQVGGRRADLWLGAASAYARNPVLGIGYGAFKPTMFHWLISTPGVRLNLFSPGSLRSGQPVHNDYLESLTELGPLGLLFFLGMIWTTGLSFVRTARRAKRLGDQFIRAASTALVIGLVTFVAGSFFLPTETSRTLWVFVGLSLALPEVLLAQHDATATGGRPRVPDVSGRRLDAPMLRLAPHVGPASAS